MSNPQISSSPYLNQIITYVQQANTKQSPSSSSNPTQPPTLTHLQNLYDQADQLIKNFQTNITRCKRYNQAKINRKYQIIIHDLQTQLKKLTTRLKIQQDSKSPTKKYITNLLDQLVFYKDQNQKLKSRIHQYKKNIQELYGKNHMQSNAIKKMQDTHTKILIERLPALSNINSNIIDTIRQYLKNKEEIRKILTNQQKSNFQKYLIAIQPKTTHWNLLTLLQQIDKWSQGIKPPKQIDMWKIRSSIAKSFIEYLDDSEKLTRPSSLNKKISCPITPVTFNQKRQILMQKKQMKKELGIGDKKDRL